MVVAMAVAVDVGWHSVVGVFSDASTVAVRVGVSGGCGVGLVRCSVVAVATDMGVCADTSAVALRVRMGHRGLIVAIRIAMLAIVVAVLVVIAVTVAIAVAVILARAIAIAGTMVLTRAITIAMVVVLASFIVSFTMRVTVADVVVGIRVVVCKTMVMVVLEAVDRVGRGSTSRIAIAGNDTAANRIGELTGTIGIQGQVINGEATTNDRVISGKIKEQVVLNCGSDRTSSSRGDISNSTTVRILIGIVAVVLVLFLKGTELTTLIIADFARLC